MSLSHGDIGCLLGPSGCGKSTALRAIAGFHAVSEGSISLNSQQISSPEHMVVPEKRNIGMVFQDYALFPHLTVFENIGFGLHKLNKTSRKLRIDRLLDLVHLTPLKNKYPHELSGGQQQRVALARSLAPEPALVLLDEPFSNLDTELRRKLSIEVRNILKELEISGILVTHDQLEAFAVSDFVGVIENKAISQWDTPFNLYHKPATPFIAKFIGQGSFLPGTMLTRKSIRCELGDITGNRAYPWPNGSRVKLLIRPDDIIFSSDSKIKARVTGKTFAGITTLYELKLDSGQLIKSSLPSHRDFQIDDTITIDLVTDHLIVFEQNN
ncbi:MAG: iron ABC transporter ATP-binding protein [Gammaproteobacteria bacterium]|nr:MAG: iron ABC transporter ATP-binding protein [Gammaproteobacteria bacterium]